MYDSFCFDKNDKIKVFHYKLNVFHSNLKLCISVQFPVHIHVVVAIC